MSEISTESLDQLIALGRKSVQVRAMIREFLDQRPVIGSLEINDLSASDVTASGPCFADKASDQMIRCLAAARACEAVESSLSAGQRHDCFSLDE
jgi:hypothetical protein